MDRQALVELVGGTIFTMEFVKRSNNERRVMNCRLGVKRKLSGGRPAYDPRDYGLLPVYDVQAKGYRSVPLDTVERVTARGVTFDTRA